MVAVDRERLYSELRESRRVALDSTVLICHLEDIRPYAGLTETTFAVIADESVGGILSAICLAELLAKPFAERRLERVAAFQPFVSSFPLLVTLSPCTRSSFEVCIASESRMRG